MPEESVVLAREGGTRDAAAVRVADGGARNRDHKGVQRQVRGQVDHAPSAVGVWMGQRSGPIPQ